MTRLVLILPLLLVACGPRTDASGASADEARQLNEAAAAMDVNASAPDAPPDDDAPDQENAQ